MTEGATIPGSACEWREYPRSCQHAWQRHRLLLQHRGLLNRPRCGVASIRVFNVRQPSCCAEPVASCRRRNAAQRRVSASEPKPPKPCPEHPDASYSASDDRPSLPPARERQPPAETASQSVRKCLRAPAQAPASRQRRLRNDAARSRQYARPKLRPLQPIRSLQPTLDSTA